MPYVLKIYFSIILGVRIPSSSFYASTSTKTLYAFLLSSIQNTCPHPSNHLTRHHSNGVWLRVLTVVLFFISFSPLSCHFFALKPTHFPQKTLLEHSLPMLLLLCERPRFTPNINYRQNYNYLLESLNNADHNGHAI